MRRHRKLSLGGPKGDINITPLVDVVLVLLIIFLVVTPMLSRGMDARVPLTDHHKKKPEVKTQLTVTVTQDGRIFVETTQVSDQELAQKALETYQRTPTLPIFIKGDVQARFGAIRKVLESFQNAGFQTIAIITKERYAAPPT